MDVALERELIQRCQAGEPDAWNELFAEHYAAVGRYVFQLSSTFTREDCDEVCQEVFLSVVKNLDRFGGRAGCKPGCFVLRLTRRSTAPNRSRPNAVVAKCRCHCKLG